MPIRIVDSQVHIWGADSPERPWPATEHKPQRERAFSRRDMLAEMRAAGVDRAIIVPPIWEGYRNDLAIEAAKLYPDKFAIMGRIAIEEPESRMLIADWRKQPGMLGVRLTFFTQQLQWLDDGTVDWFWPAAEKAGIPVMMFTPGNVRAIRQIAERYHGIKLIVDNMAIPRGAKGADAFAHIQELCSLARLSNVAVKVTALPAYADDPYPHPRIHPYVRRMYDEFGPQRLFWGADITRLPCSYALCVRMFTEEMRWMTGEDLDLIMGRAVCEWLEWPLPTE